MNATIMSNLETLLGRFFRASKEKESPVRRFYLWKGQHWALFAHHILRSDSANQYHTHPWDGVSVIFGRYREQILGKPQVFRMGVNLIRASQPHRIDIARPVWTLFFHFKRKSAWGIYDNNGNIIAADPWRGPDAVPHGRACADIGSPGPESRLLRRTRTEDAR
jgi:hypothetical protein